MKEEALLFGKTRSLVGIITDPQAAKRSQNLPGVIFLNAGIIHRVGFNRIYVKMARDLAAMGFVGFRFDFSGIGDSSVRGDNLSVEKRWVSETQEAMNCLSAARGIARFVLIGSCSGAYASLKTAYCDPRVMGTVLINLQGEKALARYYWRLTLSNPKIWLRTISGKARYRGFMRMVNNQLRSLFSRKREDASTADTIASDLRLLAKRGINVLLVHCEWDQGLDYFRAALGDDIHELSASGKLCIETIPGMSHEFHLLWGQEHLLQTVHTWALQSVDAP